MSQVILQKVNHNYIINIYKIMEYKYIVYENMEFFDISKHKCYETVLDLLKEQLYKEM